MSSRKIDYVTNDAVCARKIEIELDGDIVGRVAFSGGCHGNAQAVSSLGYGMKSSEVVDRMKGINCKAKGTSCADQLARALEKNVVGYE